MGVSGACFIYSDSVICLTLSCLASYLFSNDEEVVKLISSLLVVLSIYVVADGTQGALTGVIKALGKQHLGGPVVVFAYYAVGLPLS